MEPSDERISALNDPASAPVPDPAEVLTISQYAEEIEKRSEDLVTVIVPTHNDSTLLPECLRLIDEGFRGLRYAYEVLVVDDHSSDGTANAAWRVADHMPIRLIELREGRGRTFSIKQGLDESTGGIVMLLDPDIRFEPGSIETMLEAVQRADVVVATRVTYPSRLYGLVSKTYRWIFGHVLLSVDADVRSGFKVFRRSILESLRFDPQFDMRIAFDALVLYHARITARPITSVVVPYTRIFFRHGAWGAIGSRLYLAGSIVTLVSSRVMRWVFPFLYPPAPHEYFAAGFTNINDYLFLTPSQSAQGHITRETVSLAIFSTITFVALLYAASWLIDRPVLAIVAFGISMAYLGLMLFKLWMMVLSMRHEQPEISDEELAGIADGELPVISIMIPLYKEQEIIPQIFRYLNDFDYPQDKLDIIFILESTDTETAQAFLAMNPPPHFKALLSPDVQPKTKPKAMNVALKVAKGDLLVIYDAEVLPERTQLKKAYLTFKRNPSAMYLHSKMDVYNANYNWLTRLYTAEFSYFYHYFMPGLVRSDFPIPISGHSTYFRREVVERVGAWDAYNVAEDCDIGIRIYRKGFGSGMMLESHTWEQSTTTIPTWVRQRTRWIQGFIQTSIVQLRYPLLLKKELKTWRNFCVFLILVPGNVVLNIMNIFQWGMFLLWHVTHAPFLEVAYAGLNLYIATTSFLVGNFLFTFYSMYALYRRKHYRIVPWALISFVYWIMLGIATVRATIHLFLHPHKWDKTSHAAVKAPSIPS